MNPLWLLLIIPGAIVALAIVAALVMLASLGWGFMKGMRR